jgi:hypothetical protein
MARYKKLTFQESEFILVEKSPKQARQFVKGKSALPGKQLAREPLGHQVRAGEHSV